MVFGLAGNDTKNNFWDAIDVAASWLDANQVQWKIDQTIVDSGMSASSFDADRWNSNVSRDLERDADVILSFGGDGTFLTTAWRFGQSGTPLLGVNLGRLGFLADVDFEEIVPALRAIVDGKHSVTPRQALEVVRSESNTESATWGLNEVVITRSGNAGLITISVSVDDTHLNNYWADGLIIATPTGSTAYSLSSGGPILDPSTNALVLTPLASHSLTMRPLVLPGNAQIEISVADADLPFVVATDGRSVLVEEPGSTLRIRCADQALNVVQLPNTHFFETLREKLMWGFRKRRQSSGDPVAR